MRTLTVERCLARAERLRLLADRADGYQDIMTYDALANEWLVLAGRLAAKTPTREHAPQTPVCTWRNIRSWFRVLESLGQAARLK